MKRDIAIFQEERDIQSTGQDAARGVWSDIRHECCIWW